LDVAWPNCVCGTAGVSVQRGCACVVYVCHTSAQGAHPLEGLIRSLARKTLHRAQVSWGVVMGANIRPRM